jgi:hypothetical protein
MAETKTTITLTWENNESFELRCRETDESDWLTIIHVDENSDIKGLWDDIASICVDFFAQRMKKVKDEMVS